MAGPENSRRDENGISLYSKFVGCHRAQLELSGVPPHFWEVLSKKLSDQIFDSGCTFTLLQHQYEEYKEHLPLYSVQALTDVNTNDSQHIYLIDHAWTYRVNTARQHLREMPGLLDRMANLMGLADEKLLREDLVDLVFNKMWKFNQTYSLNGLSLEIEDRMPVWYMMDEFGSAIQHSDDPNFRTVPLYYLPEQITYTLLFPLKNVSIGDEITRDFVEGQVEDKETRQALLLPWHPQSFISHGFELKEPNEEYFLDGHIRESLPSLPLPHRHLELDEKLKVYSEYKYINEYLTHPRFEVVIDEAEADILWFMFHFKNFKELSEQCPQKFINQFPFENVITIKDLLSIVARRNVGDISFDPVSLETFPVWHPSTFNLKTELAQFISYYQQRDDKLLDNHWIIKPWNLARGLDTHVTNNLDYILKLFFTGPKIAQKYIERPVLFHRDGIGGAKFDIRYVILLKSVEPLRVYAYRNFFLRFANHPFELKDFDDYEKHFTVMNYQDDTHLCKLLCNDFVVEFQRQNPDTAWKSIEDKIFTMLFEVVAAAKSRPAPCGISPNPQSRAVYAADIMLEWKTDDRECTIMQPKLLEINWTPDCKRACEYYPDFYNDIFALLFLDQLNDSVFQLLQNDAN